MFPTWKSESKFWIFSVYFTNFLSSSGGAIVYNASIAAYQILPLIAAYSVSKTALLGLAKAVAAECASMNIRANVVCPGIVQTKFAAQLTDYESISEEVLRPMLIKRFVL